MENENNRQFRLTQTGLETRYVNVRFSPTSPSGFTTSTGHRGTTSVHRNVLIRTGGSRRHYLFDGIETLLVEVPPSLSSLSDRG